MPTLSKTTVYNTLNIFVSNNIIQEIIIEENERKKSIVLWVDSAQNWISIR